MRLRGEGYDGDNGGRRRCLKHIGAMLKRRRDREADGGASVKGFAAMMAAEMAGAPSVARWRQLRSAAARISGGCEIQVRRAVCRSKRRACDGGSLVVVGYGYGDSDGGTKVIA